MKKEYFSPQIKVETYTPANSLLEVSYIGGGGGKLDAKPTYGFWEEVDDEDED